ncbi:MAG: RDD family protein [Mycobacteriales bacterium]
MVGVPGETWIVTGEAVPVDLRVARVGSRLLATLIDFAVQGLVLGGLFAVALPSLLPGGDLSLALAVLLGCDVGVLLGYPVLCEALWNGRTLGKAALGLRVVRDDGGPIRFRQALVRGLVGLFVERPGITLGIAALVSSMSSQRAKRLGDVFAGTVVLHERVPRPRTVDLFMPPELAAWAASLDLSALPDSVALGARQFLARAAELSPAAREQLGARVVTDLAARTAPPPPPGTSAPAFVTAILVERRRRATPAAPLAPAPQPAPAPAPVPGSVPGSGPFAPPG